VREQLSKTPGSQPRLTHHKHEELKLGISEKQAACARIGQQNWKQISEYFLNGFSQL